MVTPLDSLPKICVILGAGASHDVANEGTYIQAKHWQPPLAAELFDVQNKLHYAEILGRYPGATIAASLLAPKLASGTVGLEEELRNLAFHRDPRVREHFKYVPPYLRDLIQQATQHYVREPGCYNQLVHHILAEHPHHVLFISLNYDNFLERALEGFDNKVFNFVDMGSYVRSDHQAKVLKLHGSIDWFAPFLETSKRDVDWLHGLDTTSVELGTRHWNIRVLRDQSQVLNLINWGSEIHEYLYPVITSPLTKKTLENDAVAPDSHLNVARDFLKDCRKYLIVGTSGLDDDLFELLRGESTDSTVDVRVVDRDQSSAIATYARFAANVSRFNDLSVDLDQVGYREGFKSYVSDDEFSRYLA